jgi:tetratricopeptide (TPR) repeat protein
MAAAADDPRRISSLYFDIALIYFRLQNFEAAGKSIRKGGENLPDPSSPMSNYMVMQYQRNMSQYYLDIHRLDSALHYVQQLQTTSRLVKSTGFLYGAWYTYAEVYAEMGENELAQIYFSKAEKLSDSISLAESKLRFYEGYIPFLLAQRKTNQAAAEALQLMEVATTENNDNMKLDGAGFLRQVYDSLRRYDSAYHYARMEGNLSKRMFSQENNNKVQALAFTEQLRDMDEAAKRTEAAEQRRENIQYALMALGIILLLTVYLLLSRRFITSARLIEFFGVVALLIVFEFLNLLLHPFLERVTNHSPLLMLIVLVAIAAILVPLHHRLEKSATNRLVAKNRQIRLSQARKTIADLEDNEPAG